MSYSSEATAFSLIPIEDFRHIFEGVPIPLLILDTNFTIVAVNNAYLQDTLTRAPDILGRSVFEVFPDNPQDPDAKGAANLRASLERALTTRQPDTMPVHRYDIRRPEEEGGGFVERYWSPLNTPVLNEQGKVTYLVHRVEDVTDFVRLSRNAGQWGSDCKSLRARIEALEMEMFQRARERHEINLSLLDSEQNLRLSQQIGRTGTFEWIIATGEVQWSAEIAALYGYPAKAFKSAYGSWRESIHPEDRAALERHVRNALSSGKFEAEWRVVWPDGNIHWMSGRAVVYKDEAGQAQRMLGVNIDITAAKAAAEMMRRVAQHDSLTGLPNRALFYEYADHLLPAMRRGHSNAALLFIDLDRFKPINDTYGHDVGDFVLKEVAQRMIASLRGEDMVARLGGDEFVAMLVNIHGEEDAASIASHLLDHLGKPYHLDGIELQVSPSIGVSLFPRDSDTVGELIKQADVAMYAAKQSGRNNFKFFHADLNLPRV
ncbi:MAG TPA: diguanylate cyclase [Azonexus sp.]|nr:diguanylate cyclase [Azonexus sp.]